MTLHGYGREYKPSLRLGSALPPNVTLLGNRKLGTLALRQRDPRLSTLANDKDVGNPEYATCHSVSHRINTRMSLAVSQKYDPMHLLHV